MKWIVLFAVIINAVAAVGLLYAYVLEYIDYGTHNMLALLLGLINLLCLTYDITILFEKII